MPGRGVHVLQATVSPYDDDAVVEQVNDRFEVLVPGCVRPGDVVEGEPVGGLALKHRQVPAQSLTAKFARRRVGTTVSVVGEAIDSKARPTF